MDPMIGYAGAGIAITSFSAFSYFAQLKGQGDVAFIKLAAISLIGIACVSAVGLAFGSLPALTLLGFEIGCIKGSESDHLYKIAQIVMCTFWGAFFGALSLIEFPDTGRFAFSLNSFGLFTVHFIPD